MTLTPASISLDLDNQWAYMKTQGVLTADLFPSYLHRIVPRILDQLRNHRQSITFFVVGKDAEMRENQQALAAIATAGHELANHSYLHEPWMQHYTEEELRRDFERAEAAITALTGVQPVGFRGPGFCASEGIRSMLVERGYLYDASSFPTVLGPVARAYFLLNSKLPAEEKKKRSGLYGSLSGAFADMNPHLLSTGLLEMPVTTMPILRVPVHMSYLMFLAQVSEALARMYWRSVIALCRVRKVQPHMLLHPTDFIDVHDVPELAFFPGMRIPAERKTALVAFVIESLQRHFRVVPMVEQARIALTTVTSPSLIPTQSNVPS
jgi:peptidoglycan-N-acetylglucosamine deacetylase